MIKIGLDYWRVCSHFPGYFRNLASQNIVAGNEIHIISAIGKNRRNTIRQEVEDLGIPYTEVHELVFRHPSESPALKALKCAELGISVFYDDREDVCAELVSKGILAFRVPRLSSMKDEESERL